MPALTGNTIQDLILDWFNNNFTGGSANMNLKTSDVPHRNREKVSYVFSGIAAAVGTTVDISQYVKGIFVISALSGGETIDVNGLIGANQDVVTGDLRVINLATGTEVSATTLANGSYLIPENLFAFELLDVNKSAGANTVTVTFHFYGA